MSQRLSEGECKLDARAPGGGDPSRELFADHGDQHLSPMRGAAMFEKKNALPGSQLCSAFSDWYDFARAGQHHADMRWHIIAAFGAVGEVIGVLRHESLEKLFQIASRSWVGVFHDHDAAARVLNKNRNGSVLDAALVDLRLHIVSDFIESLAVGAHFEL